MFITHNKVRMHDTDMAGILYFARQFRFAHDAWEDFIASEGLNLHDLFNGEGFAFVIVHAEADFLAMLQVGDALEVHVSVEKIGTTSFTSAYKIYKPEHILVGKVKMVHVTLDARTRKKIPIPEEFRQKLAKIHYIN